MNDITYRNGPLDPQDLVAVFIWLNIAASGITTESAVMTYLASYSLLTVEATKNDALSTTFF